MKMLPFETEEFFKEHEFSQPYLVSASDCESMTIGELIQLGGGSLADFSRLSLGYTEVQGNASLSGQVSSLYRSVSADEVVILGTPVEGIYLALQTLLEKDDHVVVLSPAYDALHNIPKSIGCSIDHWMLNDMGRAWALDVAALKVLINSRTKHLVINFPHNPT